MNLTRRTLLTSAATAIPAASRVLRPAHAQSAPHAENWLPDRYVRAAYKGPRRSPGAVAALNTRAGRLWRLRQRHESRGARCRSPEQTRCWRDCGTAMVRPRQRRSDRRGGEFRCRSGGCRASRQEGEEQGLPQFRRGDLRSDRFRLQRQHDPLGVRHLHVGEVHRRRDGKNRWRQLVLHHRGLRLR